MTKSRPSATKLRLSRLFRCLAVLCFMKVVILGMITLDMPWPTWIHDQKDPSWEKTATEQVSQQGVQQNTRVAQPEKTDAALMAQSVQTAQAPMQAGSGFAHDAAVPQHTATPLPLSVQPERQTPLPSDALLAAESSRRPQKDEGLLDMLGLTRLPIPALGSVQTAHAAVQDMPVPQPPAGSSSPFAPAEQLAPMGYAPGLPGQNTGQQFNQMSGQAANGPALPRSRDITQPAPVPHIKAETPHDDPNGKTQELARQQQDILMLRQQMDQRLKELEEAERKMKDMINEARDLEEKKVRHLIQMYANMKPRKAAQALESMDERVAVRILSGMAPKQSGEILTYTNPAKTAKFTELITRMRLPE
ncbi:MAG: hypothetical protein IJD16_08870 [Desulfovibrio sp.]|nr:hypothetical protein [Desulfovibrio sp.]